jgi:ribosomal protein S27AE
MKKSELQKEATQLLESQLIKICIDSIGNLNTQTKVELDKNSGELKLITKVSFEAEIQPESISELLKLQKKASLSIPLLSLRNIRCRRLTNMQPELMRTNNEHTGHDERYIMWLVNSGMTFETAAAVYTARTGKSITAVVLKHIYFKAKGQQTNVIVKMPDGHIKRPKRQCPVCGSYRAVMTDYRRSQGMIPQSASGIVIAVGLIFMPKEKETFVEAKKRLCANCAHRFANLHCLTMRERLGKRQFTSMFSVFETYHGRRQRLPVFRKMGV